MTFLLNVHQDKYLIEGADEAHALLQVTSEGGHAADTTEAQRAVVVIIGIGGRMAKSDAMIETARLAAKAAIERLPDGTLFGLVSGNRTAHLLYPKADVGLARANDSSRAEAIEIVRGVQASVTSAMSTWIDAARELLEPYTGAIRLALVIADGSNDGDRPGELAAALARSAGVFRCDVRGVGSAWEAAELRMISSSLLGELHSVSRAEDIIKDFDEFLARDERSNVDVRLRIWVPKESSIRYIAEVSPHIVDITDLAVPVGSQQWDFPTGVWTGHNTKDYHLVVHSPPGEIGEERAIARVHLVVGGEIESAGLVRAIWTEDLTRSKRISREVAFSTGRQELSQVVDEALTALEEDDFATATVKFGRAVQLAWGNDERTFRLLEELVEIENAASGLVRIRPRNRRRTVELDVVSLSSRSVRTTGSRWEESDIPSAAPSSLPEQRLEVRAISQGPDQASGRIFISSASKADNDSVAGALMRAGFEPHDNSSLPLGEDRSRGFVSALSSSSAFIAVLPPANRSAWVYSEIESAAQVGIPVVIVVTSASAPGPPSLPRYVTLRSDLDDLNPIIQALRAAIQHAAKPGVVAVASRPALDPGTGRRWTRSLENAVDESRFERQVSMMLTSVGIELQPPDDTGPDFVGWSDSVTDLLGNPFLVEIKRNESDVDDIAQRRWLAQSGVRSLILLLGPETDVAVERSSDGYTIFHLPVIALVDAMQRRSLSEAFRELVERAGMES
jgi:hypothetical protein